MKCTITINMDNAAFEEVPGTELARILRRVANSVDGEIRASIAGRDGKLRDINGNTVGRLSVEGE